MDSDLEELITEEALDHSIKTTKSLTKLNTLVQIKKSRISKQTSKKISFSFYSICQNESDHITDLCSLLRNGLFIVENFDDELDNLLKYLEKLDDSDSRKLRLLNAIMQFSIEAGTSLAVNNFEAVILSSLDNDFVITEVLPNYFKLSPGSINKIYSLAINNKLLKVFCVLFKNFETYLKTNSAANSQFAQLLESSLSGDDNFCKKQSVFLLSKYIKLMDYNEPAWQDYFILLDTSTETPLHLIEPSLHLLNSTEGLGPFWQSCLLKIFLSHSQITVSYYAAVYVMRKDYYNINPAIVKPWLIALNKNEYSNESCKVFDQLKQLASRLSDESWLKILQVSVNIIWIPSAVWCFCNNFLVGDHKIPNDLALNFVRMLNKVPDITIREGCLQSVGQKFECNSLNELIALIQNVGFETYLKTFKIDINKFKEQLSQNLSGDLDVLEIQCKLLNTENFAIHIPALEPCQKSDLIYSILIDRLENIDIDTYLINRVNDLQSRDLKNIFLICEKVAKKVENFKAMISKSTQEIPVFISLVLNKNNVNAVNLLKGKFLKMNERISKENTEVFLDAYFCNNFDINEAFIILNNLFNTQDEDIICKIFTKISYLVQAAENLECLDIFYEQITKLKRNCSFHKVVETFCDNVYQESVFQYKTVSKILRISRDLLKMAEHFDFVAELLAEKLEVLTRSIPDKTILFKDIIVDLLLFGTYSRKEDRIQYFIYKEIGPYKNYRRINIKKLACFSMQNLVSSEGSADPFVDILLERYLEFFNKRYFPDSSIHLQKVRIFQALLYVHKSIRNKNKLVNLIIDSFSVENHQTSVRHLMQLLLIELMRNDKESINLIKNQLISIDHNRPSNVAAFAPVLYRLALKNGNATSVAEVLLPWTMGPQFKLRAFSQAAIIKLHEKSNDEQFHNKFEFLYKSLKMAEEKSGEPFQQIVNNDFLDYVQFLSYDTFFYTIPKVTKVTPMEWENYKPSIAHNENIGSGVELIDQNFGGIQKKLTFWNLDELDSGKINDFILITTLIDKNANLGGLTRTCEVFGVKKLILSNAAVFKSKDFQSLSMSSQNWVDIMEVKSEQLRDFLLEIRKNGYCVIAAEQTNESIKLNEYKFKGKTALLLGNEKEGVPPNVIPLMDNCVEIPQFGVVRSLNVHVAGAIVIWEYCKQHCL